MTKSRGVITIAFGQKKYIQMAKGLARSLILNSPRVNRGIVTDSDDTEIDELFQFRGVIPEGIRGRKGLELKLYLEQMTPFDETLFLDADTLVFAELDDLWDRFSETPFSPVGRSLHELPNYWNSNPKHIKSTFNLETFPAFNGGLYYFRNEPLAHKVFETARALRDQYDVFNFARLGGRINDEPLISVAMAIHGLSPVANEMPIMSVVRDRAVLNVLHGKRMLYGDPVTEPVVLHFCNRRGAYVYFREKCRLQFANGNRTLSFGYEVLSKVIAFREYAALRLRNARRKLRKMLDAST